MNEINNLLEDCDNFHKLALNRPFNANKGRLRKNVVKQKIKPKVKTKTKLKRKIQQNDNELKIDKDGNPIIPKSWRDPNTGKLKPEYSEKEIGKQVAELKKQKKIQQRKDLSIAKTTHKSNLNANMWAKIYEMKGNLTSSKMKGLGILGSLAFLYSIFNGKAPITNDQRISQITQLSEQSANEVRVNLPEKESVIASIQKLNDSLNKVKLFSNLKRTSIITSAIENNNEIIKTLNSLYSLKLSLTNVSSIESYKSNINSILESLSKANLNLQNYYEEFSKDNKTIEISNKFSSLSNIILNYINIINDSKSSSKKSEASIYYSKILKNSNYYYNMCDGFYKKSWANLAITALPFIARFLGQYIAFEAIYRAPEIISTLSDIAKESKELNDAISQTISLLEKYRKENTFKAYENNFNEFISDCTNISRILEQVNSNNNPELIAKLLQYCDRVEQKSTDIKQYLEYMRPTSDKLSFGSTLTDNILKKIDEVLKYISMQKAKMQSEISKQNTGEGTNEKKPAQTNNNGQDILDQVAGIDF